MLDIFYPVITELLTIKLEMTGLSLFCNKLAQYLFIPCTLVVDAIDEPYDRYPGALGNIAIVDERYLVQEVRQYVEQVLSERGIAFFLAQLGTPLQSLTGPLFGGIRLEVLLCLFHSDLFLTSEHT